MEQSNGGHRGRLLQRFDKGGLDGMHDYEIMELLLTCIIPRKDTKPIAKDLIDRFGSVSSALHAPTAELLQVEGIGPRGVAFISFFRELISYCLTERFQGKSVLSHRSDVEAYLRFQLGQKRDEYIAVLFLDSGNHVLRTEIVAEGTVNQCVLHPRTIIEKALHYGAASMIIVHNHPGGSQRASEADWALTVRLFQSARILDIALLDHIIIARDSAVSLREQPRWPQ
jgi:DNA repair protein RadC